MQYTDTPEMFPARATGAKRSQQSILHWQMQKPASSIGQSIIVVPGSIV
jgi:hypothetical protein